jgi:starch-binding outer membrane protein, SusD/RagB family
MKKITYYLTILIISTQFISCESILSPNDENFITADYATVNPSNAEGILLNAYSGVITQYQFTDVAADDAVSNQLANSFRKMATGELTSQFNPLSRWDKYEEVFYVNKFLSIIDKVTWSNDTTINTLTYRRLKGEALALRALHHYYILEGHAGKDKDGNLLGIPYIKEFLNANDDFNIPRLSFEASIEAIMKDFDDAFELLPYIYSNNAADIPEKDKGYNQSAYLTVNGEFFNLRICGKIVKALQARVKLFAASPAYLNDVESYTQAAMYAASVIKDVNFVLPASGIEYYDDDNDKTNTEIIWRKTTLITSDKELNNFPPSLNGNGNVNPSQNLVDAFPMADGYPINGSGFIAYNPLDPYTNRDPRLAKYILVNGGSIGAKTIYTDYSGQADAVNKVSQRSTRTGYYLKKLLRPDVIIPVSGTATPKNHFDVYVRYTELFLILAEAQNEIGGPDYEVSNSSLSAKEIMRLIRARGIGLLVDPYLEGISDPAKMRDLIRNERRLELCFEGFRVWDLRRWNSTLAGKIYGSFDNGDGSGYQQIEVEDRLFDGDKYKYMPIPYSETLKYNKLIQNAGW